MLITNFIAIIATAIIEFVIAIISYNGKKTNILIRLSKWRIHLFFHYFTRKKKYPLQI